MIKKKKRNEEKELLKFEKLKRKEQEKIGIKNLEEDKIEEELTSRLKSFEIKETKKN